MSDRPKLIIERLRDWSYGAFEDENTASCIAIGMTEEEARVRGEFVLAMRKQHRATQEQASGQQIPCHVEGCILIEGHKSGCCWSTE